MPVFIPSIWLISFLKKDYQFEWDEFNELKNLIKHGQRVDEIEKCFADEKLHVVGICISPDFLESRYAIIGRTEEKLLFIVFTIRSNKIRVISARKANRNERGFYEQE